jgi:hypothetical protein
MIRRILSLILLLTTIGAIFAAIGEEALSKRLAWFVLVVGCPLMATTLHPELTAGLRRGMEEFRKATQEVNRDWFD